MSKITKNLFVLKEKYIAFLCKILMDKIGVI